MCILLHHWLASTPEVRYSRNDSPCLQVAALFVNMGRSKGVPPLTPPALRAGEHRATHKRRSPAVSEKSESLSRNFAFRLTEEDGAIWDEKIASSGLSNSEFIREAVIKNKSEVVSAPPQNPALVRQNYLLATLSRNMNQIAHRLNSDNLIGLVTPAVYAAILDELESISIAMKEL